MKAQAVLLAERLPNDMPHAMGSLTPISKGKVPARAVKSLRRTGRILMIGDDPNLLSTRHLLLQSCGHDVTSVSSAFHVEDNLIRSFDLLILCHTINSDRLNIANTIQATHPRITTLFLTRAHSATPSDGLQTTEPTPTMLLDKIQHLLTLRYNGHTN